MATTSAIATSFKTQMLSGIHAFATTVTRVGTAADTFYMSLYTSTATMDATTTTYTSTNEISGTGYTAAGKALTSPTVGSTPVSASTGTAFLDFVDPVWNTATFTARACMIYNFTQGGVSGKTVAVIDFGADKTATAGDFTVIFPANDYTNAIIRFA